MKNFSLNPQPKDVMQEIAFREKKLRKQFGYSQVELATRADVSLGSLKRFERTGEISLTSLLKLAQILDGLDDFKNIFPPKNDVDKRIHKLFEE